MNICYLTWFLQVKNLEVAQLVVLALCPSWGFTQAVSHTCSHLKTDGGWKTRFQDGCLPGLLAGVLNSVPRRLSTGMLSILMTWHVASFNFLQIQVRKDLGSKVAHQHFYFILFIRSRSLGLSHTQGEGIRLHLWKGGTSKNSSSKTTSIYTRIHLNWVPPHALSASLRGLTLWGRWL